MKQAGSLVNADRLRFDFSHYAAVTDEEIQRIESLANSVTLGNTAVANYETSKEEALAKGAMAFFGDKYGDRVRVLEAGPSVELCGGTHVRATGDIGLIRILSEGSVGANLRRIEAVAGARTLEVLQADRRSLGEAARLLGSSPELLVEGVQRRLDELKSVGDENKTLRAQMASTQAVGLAARATDGVCVERVDGLNPGELRDLAIAVRQHGVPVVVLGGVASTGGVSLVAAVSSATGRQAGDLLKDAARAVGGGGGGKGDVATAGGKNPEGLDEALRIASEAARR